ncbi:MAG: hypothetical protein FWH36_07925 [Lentimicrobiaceae bacterium]|nr:hypothetical protein [Lentimicrobiaceae bacterium]
MSVSEEKKLETVSTLPLNYLPAILKENKSGWLVEYYVEHPVHHNLVRKTKKVNHVVKRYKSKLEARRHVLKMTNNINIKLSTGWNPHFTSEDARLYTPVSEVCEKFLKEKEKESRKNTMRSYASFAKLFSNMVEV